METTPVINTTPDLNNGAIIDLWRAVFVRIDFNNEQALAAAPAAGKRTTLPADRIAHRTLILVSKLWYQLLAELTYRPAVEAFPLYGIGPIRQYYRDGCMPAEVAREAIRGPLLREWFITEYIASMNMFKVSKYQRLSEPFMRQYAHLLKWDCISECQELSEPFMDEFAARLDWWCAAREQEMSAAFVARHLSAETASPLCIHKRLDIELIAKQYDLFRPRVHLLYRHQQLSEALMEQYLDDVAWDLAAEYQVLSEPFIEQYIDRLSANIVCRYQVLSEAFMERHSRYIDWRKASKHQRMSEAFMERNADQLDWTIASIYQTMSEAFMERNADNIDWYEACKYQQMGEAFLERNADHVCWQIALVHQHLSAEFSLRWCKQLIGAYRGAVVSSDDD